MSDGLLHIVTFYALAGLTLGSAGIVALSRNIIHSTISLLGTFLGVAGLYISLSADFLAAVQILVYVGGTLTLLLFAVMLTAKIEDVRTSNTSRGRWAAFVVIGLLLLVLGRVATTTAWPAEARDPMPSTAKLGHAFLSEYLLPFEVASVLLLGAMIGAVILARRAVKREYEEE
ncbi:MAG: NADH-quinone oxidoreductase subunit J [Deltaproteobacteria bacterium HGW-Deltaproteobacteria-20]|jgi:NAD(P)H-quinone oxidoreductase subunit 6|nr:MAG: NADH-quinone oxidoreductase subunit J [Deltaproteobacteria bacterium HGW-Deltaproteobacteria-20]